MPSGTIEPAHQNPINKSSFAREVHGYPVMDRAWRIKRTSREGKRRKGAQNKRNRYNYG